MLPEFLKGITADVNLSESEFLFINTFDHHSKALTFSFGHSSDEYVMNEKGRYVPLSISPFRDLQATKYSGQSHGEEEIERPPEWLELVRKIYDPNQVRTDASI